MNDSRSVTGWLWFALRLICGLAILLGCYKLIAQSWRIGIARLSNTAAIASSRLDLADNAVRLAPEDPETHYTRGLELVNAERLTEAVAELRIALNLRPHHYYEWLDLGVTLDRLGDQAGALEAISESIRLAPSFAQPRWQMGNLLYRQGNLPAAFEQLRLGATSNPRLFESLIEMAWASSEDSVSVLESLVRPQTQRDSFELAKFLAGKGKGDDAARIIVRAGIPTDETTVNLSRGAIYQLIANNQFAAAYSAWAPLHNVSAADNKARFTNGDFNQPIPNDDPGFGWQLPPVVNLSRAISPDGPAAGQRSFRIEYSGDSPIGARALSQLILVRPKTRYAVKFMARTDRLVSGGPPVVVVADANTGNPRILGQSSPLPESSGWTSYSVELFTGQDTSALNVWVQRIGCRETPCPIFGVMWLAKFEISAEALVEIPSK